MSNFKWKIFSNFVAFLEYPNFKIFQKKISGWIKLIFEKDNGLRSIVIGVKGEAIKKLTEI